MCPINFGFFCFNCQIASLDACLVLSHLKLLEHFTKSEETLRPFSVPYSFINFCKHAWKSCWKRKEESRPQGTKKIESPSCWCGFGNLVASKNWKASPFDLISLSHASCRNPGFTMRPSWHLLLPCPRCFTQPCLPNTPSASAKS